MEKLALQSCEACSIDASPLAVNEYKHLLDEISSWKVITIDDINRLFRVFKFSDYQSALTFTNNVAALADEVNHHPALLLEWGAVSVTWWSHKIKGLHKNDFIMAAKTNLLAKTFG